jgi:hypothetical protein
MNKAFFRFLLLPRSRCHLLEILRIWKKVGFWRRAEWLPVHLKMRVAVVAGQQNTPFRVFFFCPARAAGGMYQA